MKAEFINQPNSGQYDEKIFDLNRVWKSQIWSWIKFVTNSGIEWVGMFRGEPKRIAIAEKNNQIGILTSNGLYILDIEDKEVLYFDEKKEYGELAEILTKDKFIISEFGKIGIIDEKFNIEFLNLEFEIDNIRFGKYIEKKLEINFEKLPNYEIINGFLNTENWKIEIK